MLLPAENIAAAACPGLSGAARKAQKRHLLILCFFVYSMDICYGFPARWSLKAVFMMDRAQSITVSV